MNPEWQQIVNEAAAAYRVSPAAVMAPQSSRVAAAARQEVMYRLANETQATLMAISRALGRDHTTVLHGIRAHAKRMSLPLPRRISAWKPSMARPATSRPLPRPWSEEEDAILEEVWTTNIGGRERELERRLPDRNRTICYRRAVELGIHITGMDDDAKDRRAAKEACAALLARLELYHHDLPASAR